MAPNPSLGSLAAVRRRLTTRKAGIVATVVLLLIFLGCMSIAIGNRTQDGLLLEDGTLVQQGEVNVPPGTEQDVYYPITYLRPPNLELTDTFDDCTLVEQREDHFRIKNTDHSFSHTATWKARGIRAPAVAVVPVPEPPQVALPPTPVAVP